MYPLKVDI